MCKEETKQAQKTKRYFKNLRPRAHIHTHPAASEQPRGIPEGLPQSNFTIIWPESFWTSPLDLPRNANTLAGSTKICHQFIFYFFAKQKFGI